MRKHSTEDVVKQVLAYSKGTKFVVLAPIHVPEGRTVEQQLKAYLLEGFARIYGPPKLGGDRGLNEGKASDCSDPQPPTLGGSYNGVEISKIIEAWLGGKVPQEGMRHDTMRDLARDIRYCLENTPKKVMAAFDTQSWIQDLIAEGDPVEATVEGACKQRYFNTKPTRLKEALIAAGAVSNMSDMEETAVTHPLYQELTEWGEKIEAMFESFPCLKEICQGLRKPAYPAALFTGAAFLGTDLTRTWYYYYHRPEEERRLNYCIYVIGDPAVGKSFATRLYKLLAAPLIAADKMSNDAINNYKKSFKERGTSTKEQKKDALKAPDVIVRVHGARTANGVFIEDMNKAVELVGSVGEKHIVHQHLFEQCHDAAAVHQVVDLVNGIVGHVDIILVAAGARNAEAEHLHHRNPVASGLGHLLGHALLPLKGGYMRLASSRLRFM